MNSFIPSSVERFFHSRRKLATFAMGVLACLLAYHVVFGANGLLVFKQKKDEYRRLQDQNKVLDEQNQEIEKQNKALESDPQAIEKEAREGLHYLRSGEVVYTTRAGSAEKRASAK